MSRIEHPGTFHGPPVFTLPLDSLALSTGTLGDTAAPPLLDGRPQTHLPRHVAFGE